MGNFTNPAQWAAQERLRFIERSAWWRGVVNRQDLQGVYGVSQAQASSDLQKYLEMNPLALSYSLKRKRYEGTPQMVCALHEPRLEEAMQLFLPGGQKVAGATGVFFPTSTERGTGAGEELGGVRVSAVSLPVRQASRQVERVVFLAVGMGLRLHIYYHSMTGGKSRWRWIAPHAFGHDGYRWHVRAWCEEKLAYRDFVLSRIKEVGWPTESAKVTAVDESWARCVTLELMPNPNLTEERQEATRLDYNLEGNRLKLKVREAMLDYTLAHLRLPTENPLASGGLPFLVKAEG